MTKRHLLLAFLLSCFTLGAIAQAPEDRNKIKQAIQNWGSCRNVAITRTYGDVALSGNHNYYANYVPNKMLETLRELYDNGNYIDDVTLTESGKWVILYDINDVEYSDDIPVGLRDAILEFNENDYYVRSISFNDDGDWVIISKEEVNASSQDIVEWLEEYAEQYGDVWTVFVGEDAIFAVFQNGYANKGEIPDGLKNAIQQTELDYYRVKFSGESWFIADEEGNYQYYM